MLTSVYVFATREEWTEMKSPGHKVDGLEVDDSLLLDGVIDSALPPIENTDTPPSNKWWEFWK